MTARFTIVLLGVLLAGAASAEDPPLSSFEALQQRPLFTPSRRASAAVSTTRLSAAGLRLTGLISESGRNFALIRSDEQKGEVRIGAGATLNGWTVTSIGAKGLELSADGQQRRVGIKQMIPATPE